jgi:hypothetical protein
VSPVALPYVPKGQTEQFDAPASENVPGAQSGDAAAAAVAYAKSPFLTSGVNTVGANDERASMNVLFGAPTHPSDAGDDAGNKFTVTDVEVAAATRR